MSEPLLAIARALHQEKGAKMTLSELAERAGVSRATIYQKLGGKPDILARIAREEGNSDAGTDIESRIMQGLLATVSERGFRAATIEDIAKSAGVGPATIYRRYGDKAGLIRHFIANRAPSSLMGELPLSEGTASQKLRALIRFLLDYMSNQQSLVRLIHSGNADDRAYLRGFRDAETSTFSQITEFFRVQQEVGCMVSHIPPQDLAANLFGMLYAHAVLSEGRKSYDPELACNVIMGMFEALMIGDKN